MLDRGTDRAIWNIVAAIQRNKIGKRIIQLLYRLGFAKLWIFLLYEKERKHPTEQMKRSAEFYRTQKERLARVEELLADDASRDILRRCIRFRCTHDRRDRPPYKIEEQYFAQGIITIQEHEVFIDGGAYNGDTLEQLQKYAGGKQVRMIAFEPDQNNIAELKTNIPAAEIIPAALWSSDTVLSFVGNQGSNSRLGESTESISIQAKAIDTTPSCKNATFIKMDIEGAEYEALLGAKQTIERNRPKLAICIYHSDEDMFRLIELIASWKLGYNLYVRHHSQRMEETVMYAVIPPDA